MHIYLIFYMLTTFYLLEKMRDLIRHARHGGGDGDVVGGEEVRRDLSGKRHKFLEKLFQKSSQTSTSTTLPSRLIHTFFSAARICGVPHGKTVKFIYNKFF